MKTLKNDLSMPLIITNKEFELVHLGLLKREYFAAMALQGLAANSYWPSKIPREHPSVEESIYAKAAVKYADALIDALNESEVK